MLASPVRLSRGYVLLGRLNFILEEVIAPSGRVSGGGKA